MIKLFLGTYKDTGSKFARVNEIFSLLLNAWLFIIIVYYYSAITNNIITSVFYNIPKPALLVVVQGCFMWSCICLVSKRAPMKLSAHIINFTFYFWIALTSLFANPLSVVTGTYLILALRQIFTYFILKAQEGGDVGTS